MYLRTPNATTARALSTVAEIVREELNVREIEPVSEDQAFVEYSIRPNLPALGPRYGRQLPAIRQALSTLDPQEVARAVESGEGLEISANGSAIALAPDDLLVTAQQREGYAAMAGNGYLVALDTNLTPELVGEGLAREVIRRINDWRKDANFNIEDRIEVRYDASHGLAEAIATHGGTIGRETLADLLCAAAPEGEFVGTATWEGHSLRAGLRRTSR
jgi:isoleucyl-tRNA synthetase